MKLILCKKCQDIVRLIPEEMRYCKCGKIFGKYTDEVNAVVSRGAVVLGIDNESLINAIRRSTEKIDTEELMIMHLLDSSKESRFNSEKFSSFLIPKKTSSLKRIRRSDVKLYTGR